MKKNLPLFFGLFFILASLGWKIFISPLIYLLPEINYVIDFDHQENNRFDIGGDWSGDNVTFGRLSVSTDKIDPNNIYITTEFQITSLIGEKYFHLKRKFAVDRQSYFTTPASGFREGVSFLFPPKVKKADHTYLDSTIGQPMKVKFIEEAAINGLKVYHFRGQEENVDESEGYDFLPLVPEKYSAFSIVMVDVFVEPVTGLIIDYSNQKTVYYVDEKENRIWDISSRSDKMHKDYVSTRIDQARTRIRSFFLLDTVTPLVFLLTGLVLVAFGLRSRQK